MCIINPVNIINSPQRSNIKYSLVSLKSITLENIFASIISDLKINSYRSQRVLLFCRTQNDLQSVYRCIDSKLKNKFRSYLKRPYARFFSHTDETVKEHVMKNFSIEKGTVWCVVAPIAFGMGIDCKGLYTVIYYGLPACLDDYFQELCRAGRDGVDSDAVLVNFPKCLNSKHISKKVKEFVLNKDACRRKLLIDEFGTPIIPLDLLHKCCDICKLNCRCDGDKCSQEQKWWNINQVKDIVC